MGTRFAHDYARFIEYTKEVLTLRPGAWGINFDVKEAWRRGVSCAKGKLGKKI